MEFTNEYRYTRSNQIGEFNFVNYRELLKKIDCLLYESIHRI